MYVINTPIENMDTHMDGAMTLYAGGDHAGAQALCRTVLRVEPHNVRALYLYGTMLIQGGQLDDAVETLSRAVALAPGFAGTRINLGVALRATGRLEEASQAYAAAIEIDPGNADVHLNLGNCLKDMGRYAEAEASYERCLELKPNYALAYDNLGLVLREQSKIDEAARMFRKAIELAPNVVSAYNNLGGVLLDAGRAGEAKEALLKAIALDPVDVNALGNLADAERRLENYAEAARIATMATCIDPNFAEGYLIVGLCQTEMGDNAGAIDSYRKALTLRPRHADARYNLARCLRYAQRYDEAIAEFKQAIELRPDFAEAYNALGALYQEIVEVDNAMRCYDKAIELEPAHVSAHWNRALMRLTIGDYDRGLTDFEWRYKLAHEHVEYTEIKQWDGESLQGKRLLVRAEQGFGDTIQCLRFLPQLRESGAHVTLECQPGLGEFIRDAGLCDVVFEANPSAPPDPGDFDRQIWLMSVPGILGIQFDTIPANIPYLKVRQSAEQEWSAKLDAIRDEQGTQIVAGIVWAGSRKNSNDHLRSMPMQRMEALADVDGVTLVSVQQGPQVTQIPEWAGSAPLVIPNPVVRSFADTAAMIMNLDVVITVDTVVAHIAGALGRPVWLLIPYGPDWRWSINREDTPWYPSMRIFRQPKPGDWPAVIENVKAELGRITRAGKG
jgi:tetratricopeptide (TPR) repeat protein